MEPDEAWHQTDRLHAGTGKGDPFAAAIRATRMPMIITDPRQPDNPIVFANEAFLTLSGYAREEIIGRNCRFLQGPETKGADVGRLRAAIEGVSDISVDLLNYRKDGSTFWNALYVSPVVDENGTLQFFFASQLDVTDRKEAELKIEAARDHFEQVSQQRTREFHDALSELQETNRQLAQSLETRTALLHEVDHRVKNNLQMVSAMILLQSRAIPDKGVQQSLMEMLSRVEALGIVHRRLYQSDDVTRFDVGDFVRDLVTDLAGVQVGNCITLTFDLATVMVPAEHAAPIALIVNELATNALKHAFPSGRGQLSTRVALCGKAIEIVIADDGVGKNVTGLSKSSFGSTLVRTLSRQLQAEVRWANNEPGTRASVDIPIRWGASC